MSELPREQLPPLHTRLGSRPPRARQPRSHPGIPSGIFAFAWDWLLRALDGGETPSDACAQLTSRSTHTPALQASRLQECGPAQVHTAPPHLNAHTMSYGGYGAGGADRHGGGYGGSAARYDPYGGASGGGGGYGELDGKLQRHSLLVTMLANTKPATSFGGPCQAKGRQQGATGLTAPEAHTSGRGPSEEREGAGLRCNGS
jgi:hypothetical protein